MSLILLLPNNDHYLFGDALINFSLEILIYFHLSGLLLNSQNFQCNNSTIYSNSYFYNTLIINILNFMIKIFILYLLFYRLYHLLLHKELHNCTNLLIKNQSFLYKWHIELTMAKEKNKLGKLYQQQRRPVRAQILEDLAAAGVSHQRFYNWTVKPDNRMVEMPTILKTIICRNIPKAESLFRLPSKAIPCLFETDA